MRLAGPVGLSTALHAAAIAAALWAFRPGPPVVLPPIYKVDIVAAPPGPRAIGEVTPAAAPAKPAPTPPKIRETPTPQPAAPVKHADAPPTRATPVEGKPKRCSAADEGAEGRWRPGRRKGNRCRNGADGRN